MIKHLLKRVLGVTAMVATGCGAQLAPPADEGADPASGTGTLALTATRPSYNTGVGFFASGGKIFDANGNEFIIRGTNYEVPAAVANQNNAIAGMNNAKLNAARLNFPAGTGAGTETANAAMVQRLITAGIVPIPAVWSPDGTWTTATTTTCDSNPALMTAVVDNWVGPQRSWLISQEKYIILNLANEWGEADTAWRDNYITAVTRIRNAGIKAMIMIDAGGACGQNAQSIESYGPAIVNADPQKNVVFSVHMYGFWLNEGDSNANSWGNPFPEQRQPYDTSAELNLLTATGLPIVVGEYCGWQGSGDVPCTYGLTNALTTFERKGLGYMSWEWMNPVSFASVTVNNVYNTSSDLYPWGRITIEDPALGSKVLAQKASIFGGSPPPSDTARYNFESGAQGWLTWSSGMTLAQSSTQKYAGAFSLADNISATAAQTKSSQVDNPTTPAGATVTTHVWCPVGAPVSAVQAWVQHGGTANGACSAFQWTGQSASIVGGQWTTISVTVPSCSVGLSHLGVDFVTTQAWTGTCYTDTVNW